MNTCWDELNDSCERSEIHLSRRMKLQVCYAMLTGKGKKTKIVAKDLHLLWIFARKCDRV